MDFDATYCRIVVSGILFWITFVAGRPLTISDVQLKDLNNWEIFTGSHCFGCTAGAGSSCQGTLDKDMSFRKE